MCIYIHIYADMAICCFCVAESWQDRFLSFQDSTVMTTMAPPGFTQLPRYQDWNKDHNSDSRARSSYHLSVGWYYVSSSPRLIKFKAWNWTLSSFFPLTFKTMFQGGRGMVWEEVGWCIGCGVSPNCSKLVTCEHIQTSLLRTGTVHTTRPALLWLGRALALVCFLCWEPHQFNPDWMEFKWWKSIVPMFNVMEICCGDGEL